MPYLDDIGEFDLGLSAIDEAVLTTAPVYDLLQTSALTVAQLPPPGPSLAGTRTWVKDSSVAWSAATTASVVSGGGTFGVPVVCDGAAWRLG